MQRPRRSILTGQPLNPSTPVQQPERPASSARAGWGPAWLLGVAVLLLLGGFALLAAWQAQPSLLPFVPRTATLTPSLTPTTTRATLFPGLSTPIATPGPEFNPSGRDVSREMDRIDMMAGGYGWGVGQSSVWRTNDGGQTWLDVTPPLSAAAGPAAAEPSSTGTPPGATAQPAGAAIRQAFFLTRVSAWFLQHSPGQPAVLYATHDGGQSWQSLQAPFGGLVSDTTGKIDLFFNDERNGWAWEQGADESYALFQTADGGQTWQKRDLSVLSLSGITPSSGPQLSFGDPQHGWLVPSGSAAPGQPPLLYASEDGGQTWEPRSLPLPDALEWSPESPLDAPYFESGLYAPGVLPARVIDRSSGRRQLMFFVSMDSGRSWQAGLPLVGGRFYSIPNWNWVFVNMDNGRLVNSVDGGIFWSGAGGSFRDSFGSGVLLEPDGIDFVDQLQGWAWQKRAGELLIFTTTDSGKTWRRLDYAAPTANTVACRWQAADLRAALIPINQAGAYQGWGLYINPAHSFSMKVAPGWQVQEISYGCAGLERDVHRVVLRAEDVPPALFTLAFRRPDEELPLRDSSSLPASLTVVGSVPFFGQQVERGVAGQPASPSAVYYNGGREIEIGSRLVFTAVLESDRAGLPKDSVSGAQVAQAEQMLASLEPLRADAELLSSMDVETTFSDSPDGRWEVEVLLARPLTRSRIGYHYQRVLVSRKNGGPQWTALDTWVRQTNAGVTPGGFTWSADGRWLYLYRTGVTTICPLFEHHNGLRRLDLQTGEVQEIDLYLENSLASLDISPDGSQVAYLPPDYLANPRVIVRSLAGEQAVDQAIAFEEPLIEHWGAGSLSWAPDGRRLVLAIAGPYCSQQTEKRIVLLVDPQAGAARVLTAQDGWLAIDRWLPDGRLRLVDRSGNLFSLDIDSGEMGDLPPDPPDRLAEAESILRGFFMMLHNTWFDPGTYQWAAEHYGGSYQDLLRLNPDVDPRDTAQLFQRACEVNGYYCLRLRRVVDREIIAEEGQNPQFRFTFELLMADGSLFSLKGQTSFEMTVALYPTGEYKVMSLPPR